jgi:class 3 adenylate cyclase
MKTRLAAILIADITGYTAYLARADRTAVEAVVRQQKQLLTPLINAHHGTIVKWMGDAVLATFESSTEAALCGRNMQHCVTRETERGAGVLSPLLKIVIHAGDIQFDVDGDIYGDAVNLCARMEKTASADGEAYFSDSVRQSMNATEIPFEPFGEFQFKGIVGEIKVYRTTFGEIPALRQDLVLVQTNFTHIHSLADKYGWDHVHPVLESVTAAIVDSTRQFAGTHRGVMQDGCFLSFASVTDAFAAADQWQSQLPSILDQAGLAPDELRVRVAIHRGTLRLMRFTMMGGDIEVVRTLAVIGSGREILLTDSAMRSLSDEGVAEPIDPVDPAGLRDCRSKVAWLAKYSAIPVYQRPIMSR